MTGFSLRLRLLATAAIAILIALLLAGAGMSWIFERHIERREAATLIRVGELLAANARLDRAGRPIIDSEPRDERFGEAASGLYWQVTGPRGAVHSQSLWDQNLASAGGAPSDRWRTRKTTGPFGAELMVVERPVVLDRGGAPILIQVATDDGPLKAARAEFVRTTAASLVVLWLVLLLAAWVQVSLGLRPLAAMRRQIAALRSNPAARLPDGHPREIAPLTSAINALAEAREADLGRARRRAGDLAHSLKTPLAALAAQSRRARETGAAEAADGLDRAIAAMRATVETELARTRAAALRESGSTASADVASLVEKIVSVVERTETGERIIFDVDIPPDLEAPLAADILTELLGALIENAARYAHRQVKVSGRAEPAACRLWVEDDGPGLDEAAIAAVMTRGGRVDEAGTGHGLGLAIVADLVEATAGTVSLGRSPLRGLSVEVAWPVERPPAPPPASLLRRLTRR